MKKKSAAAATELVGVRIPKDIKDTLTEMARDDTRTVASLIHKILKEYLASKVQTKIR